MYNKNILAPLATFISKVRSFVNVCVFFRACPDSVLRAIYPRPGADRLFILIMGPVQLTLGFSFRILDFVDSGAIYRLPQNGARERAEGCIRIRRKRHYHFVVSLVS